MIQETLNWYSGEIFEGKFILSFGFIIGIFALLFYFLGNTAGSKALLIPLLVVSLFWIVGGLNMIYTNNKKINAVEIQFNKNQENYIKSEIKRVEDFQYLYPMSIGISLFCFNLALGLLFFSKNIHFQAIAIALILFGTSFATIDYFSKERATIYYNHLISKK